MQLRRANRPNAKASMTASLPNWNVKTAPKARSGAMQGRGA